MTSFKTVAAFEDYTGTFSDGHLFQIINLALTGDRGGGFFQYLSENTTTPDGAITLKQNSVTGAGRAIRYYQGKINGLWFGMDPTGSADSTQALINLRVACETIGTTSFIPHGTYKLSGPVKINLSLAGFICDNIIFDVSGVAENTGSILTFNGSVTPPYNQAAIEHGGFYIFGPGRSVPGNTGIEYVSTSMTGAGPSSNVLRHFGVCNFANGIVFGANAYIVALKDGNIYQCGVCYSVLSATNSGERLVVDNVTMYNSDLAFSIANGDADVYFSKSSFDFCTAIGSITGGKCFAENCHFEATNWISPPIVINGGSTVATFEIQGGIISADGSNAVSFVNNVDGYCKIVAFVNNFGPTVQYLVQGAGISIVDTYAGTIGSNPIFTSPFENAMIDGNFQQSEIYDAFISADTAVIDSRLTGTNIALSLSTAQKYNPPGTSGAIQSLCATKLYGEGALSQFTFYAPIQPGSRQRQQIYYRKPGSQTGTLFIAFGFARMNADVAGAITPLYQNILGSLGINLTSSDTGWTAATSGEPVPVAPAWATHSIISINMVDFIGPGEIYFGGGQIGKAP